MSNPEHRTPGQPDAGAPQASQPPLLPATTQVSDEERYAVLEQLEDWLEIPVIVLGFVWLLLLVVDFVHGLNPFLSALVAIIWVIFALDFSLRFVLAPHKLAYLRRNWLTALSLVLPALRVFRIVRVIRLLRLATSVRPLSLVRVVASVNRGMRALRLSLRRRGFGYVIALTLIITLVGSAGMYALEGGPTHSPGFDTFGDALWWTSMIMTTMGSQSWPQTLEGRILGFLLSLYAFATFGYLTATLATYFLGREAESDETEIAGMKSIESLRQEIALLRSEITALRAENPPSGSGEIE